ncbi:Stk1 family PASTA domain-containing Ser/Thr kinase [Ornithinimicrobium sp. Y1847]|uniref:Stk1 family PASTA domain-containing Ser/Thr kinase n=1 Tax=Ornithinimicrobium sp. Y1847 TaxID=3405419 RepID=UPI003B6754F0
MSGSQDLWSGRVLDGRYQIDSELARGGMATVYRAQDLRLDRPVALKVMRADLARDETFVRRFVHEARAAARLQHPHIVSVYDQGEDDGCVYLAMELVEGQTLRDVIRTRAPLSTRQALDLLLPVTEALAAAHAAGMVHRDVKPENVLLGTPHPRTDPIVKVADFGLARMEGVASVTTEMLWATAAYLAPEQIDGQTSDPRTDVYAVALLLFELVTGRKAFPGEDPVRVAYEHVHGGVPHARELAPTVPRAVEQLILRAGAVEPDDRPQDATELLHDLRTLRLELSDTDLDALPGGDETIPVQVDGDRTQVVPVGTPHQHTRHSGSTGHTGHTDHSSQSGATATRALPVRDGIPGRASSPAAPGGYARTTGNRSPARRPAPPAPRPARRRGIGGWIIGLLLLALLAGGGYGFWYLTEGPAVHSEMPPVAGLTQVEAREALDRKELDAFFTPVYSEDVPADTVISADYEPGAVLRHGTDVTMELSQGPERYAVPRLDGVTPGDAVDLLRDNQLSLGEQHTEHHETIPAGQIIRSDPEVGAQVPPGTAVQVWVSDGLAPVGLPNVVGSTEAQATGELSRLGLTVEIDPQRVSDEEVPEGSVVSQDPTPGEVEAGSTVRLVISDGPELVEIPQVVGRQFSAVEQELTDLGLVVTRDDVRGGFFGSVRSQSIEPGEMVPRGTEIVLEVV